MGKQGLRHKVPISGEHVAYFLVISIKYIYTLATHLSLLLINFTSHRVLHVAI